MRAGGKCVSEGGGKEKDLERDRDQEGWSRGNIYDRERREGVAPATVALP